MRIPLARPELGEEEIAKVAETIRSGWITQGPRVAEFERAFAEYVGAPAAVAVSSCTTALHLSLLLLGVRAGDEVIVPSHTFIASANAIRYCGARPVFADIEPDTLNLSPQAVADALTPRTKALMVVHQIGRPANLDALKIISDTAGIPMIEDAACATGSEYRGRKIGANSYAALVCFSFHPRKIMSTGDGGMITTDNPAWAERLRRLRQHGMSVNDLQRHQASSIITEEYHELGYNYRMTDIQGALGLVQLGRLPQIIERRRALAATYDRELAGLSRLGLFQEPPEARWNHQTYAVRLMEADAAQRDALMQKLLDTGIATRRGIMSIHREACYREDAAGNSWPESERASDQCICLPLYSQMSAGEQSYVLEHLRRALA